jgi:hypothetical protein
MSTNRTTFVILEVSSEAYAEVRACFIAVDAGLSSPGRDVRDYQDEYIRNFGTPDELIVLGAVALREKKLNPEKPVTHKSLLSRPERQTLAFMLSEAEAGLGSHTGGPHEGPYCASLSLARALCTKLRNFKTTK